MHVNVLACRYGQIYSNFSDDRPYNVSIGNFLECSFVYFSVMLATSLVAMRCMCNVNM
jgi:hypothetical protein